MNTREETLAEVIARTIIKYHKLKKAKLLEGKNAA
jgi:hypothetical protein